VDHIIAQGQENSARENLSFIERAAFAQRLLGLGYDRTVIQQALSVDAPMLTRMLSVSGRVPSELIEAIGSAKGIGRDRWLEFTTLFEHPLCAQAALALVDDERLTAMSSESRFGLFLAAMRQARKPARKATTPDRWHSSDDGVTAEFKGAGRSYSIALKSKDAARFGRFVAQNLERLHQEFVRSMKSQGD
jgi:ParB family transcriptional regulator, chromosome partitioning protein